MHKKDDIKIGSEKSFGIVFFVVFMILGIFLSKNYFLLSISSFLVSAFFLFSGFFFQKILKTPNILWFKFGILISKVTSPIIMFILYSFVVLPTGIFYSFLKKKQYTKSMDIKLDTYWIDRNDQPQSMDKQF